MEKYTVLDSVGEAREVFDKLSNKRKIVEDGQIQNKKQEIINSSCK